MTRHLTVAALLLTLSACSKSQAGLATIEDAEAFAKARGVTLAEKKENTVQIVAPRVYDYKAGEVKIGIMQFHTSEAGAEWKKMMDESPFAPETRVQNGAVVFQIYDGDDAARQKVITALQQ